MASYEILKGALVDAGFNDGRQFTIEEARKLVLNEFKKRGYSNPSEKVARELRYLEGGARDHSGNHRGGGVLIRVKKGVYKFAKPVGTKKPLFYKHRPGRPGTYHTVTNVRKMIVNQDDNPQPNPTDWVLQEEWDDV